MPCTTGMLEKKLSKRLYLINLIASLVGNIFGILQSAFGEKCERKKLNLWLLVNSKKLFP